MRYGLRGVLFVGILILMAPSAWAKSPVMKEQEAPIVKGMHLKGQPEKPGPIHGMVRRDAPLMVSTLDGGVIVLAGGKLKKFDKDLNLIKEVVLDPGFSGAKTMNCPMMKAETSVSIQKKGETEGSKNIKK